MTSYLTQTILQNIFNNDFSTSGTFSCSALTVGGGDATFQGNVNIAGTSSLNVNNIINASVYRQSGVDFNSIYAMKNATSDQIFSGNIIIGSGKPLSTPVIVLNGDNLTNTLNSLQTKADMTTYITSGSLRAYKTIAGLNKSSVGVGNVDNTSASSLPISTATQTALDLKANLVSPNFTGTPIITNNAIATRPWVIARINAGAGSIAFQNGLQTATVTRNNVGDYTLVWPNTGLGTSYVQLTCAAFKNQPRHINYLGLTATGCNVYMTDTTGASVDVDVNIRVDVFS